jgi:hypothetical protein
MLTLEPYVATGTTITENCRHEEDLTTLLERDRCPVYSLVRTGIAYLP